MDWHAGPNRRSMVLGSCAAILVPAAEQRAALASDGAIRFGLTPVFLNNDLDLLNRLRSFLTRLTGRRVSMVSAFRHWPVRHAVQSRPKSEPYATPCFNWHPTPTGLPY